MAALILIRLEQRDEEPGRHGGPVQGVHESERPAPVTEADVQPPGLIVGRVRAGGDLPVALLARDPCLDVVLLGGGRPEITGGGDHDPVGDAEAGDDVLLDGEDLLVMVAGDAPGGRRRTSPPCRTGAPGRCRGCRARRHRPHAGSRWSSPRIAGELIATRTSPWCSPARATSEVPVRYSPSLVTW